MRNRKWTCRCSARVYSEFLLRHINHFNKANRVELGCHLSRIQSCELKGVGELACYGNVFSVDNFKNTYTPTLLKTLLIQPNINLKKRLLVFHCEVKSLNGATSEHNEGGLGDLSGFLRSGQVRV